MRPSENAGRRAGGFLIAAPVTQSSGGIDKLFDFMIDLTFWVLTGWAGAAADECRVSAIHLRVEKNASWDMQKT